MSFDKEFHRLERKKGIEFNELKGDIQRATKNLNDSLKARTKEQVSEVTKKAIAENEQMKTELSVHCKQTEWLLARNEALTDENCKLRRHLSVHKDLEKELVKRSNVQQRVIVKFSEDRKGQTPSSDARSPLLEDDITPEPTQPRFDVGPRGDSRIMEQRCTRLQEELEASKTAHRQTRLEFTRYRKEHQTLAQLQDWGAREVAAALQQLRTTQDFSASGGLAAMESSEGFGRLGRLTRSDREAFLTRLYDVLRSSACKDCQQHLATPHPWSRPVSKLTSSTSTPSLPPISKGSPLPVPGVAAGGERSDTGDLSAFLRSLGAGGEEPAVRTAVTEEKAVQATEPMQGGQYTQSYGELPRGLQLLNSTAKGGSLRSSGRLRR